MDRNRYCSRALAAVFAAAALTFAAPAVADPGVGNGTLTVDNDTSKCPGASGFFDDDHPTKFNVLTGLTIHMNISPGFGFCSAGAPQKLGNRCGTNAECASTTGKCAGNNKCTGGSPVNAGGSCTSDAQCNIAGVCNFTLDCPAGPGGDVIVKGHHGVECTSDSDCPDAPNECDEDEGFCIFHDTIPATVVNNKIDVCYTTRSDMCLTAVVAYCGDVGHLSNREHPAGTRNFSSSGLRSVDSNGDPIEDCKREVEDCTNEVGSFCCSLSQGAYGAPQSVATAPCTHPLGCGFIDAAINQGCDPFAPACPSNATTAGVVGLRSVTIGNKATLIDYLPSGGTPGPFHTSGPNAPGAATCYSATGQIPDQNPKLGNSKGQGSGALGGQAMAARMNTFLSNCPQPFGGSSTFTASGFDNFQLPSAGVPVCTKRAGSDKVLGTGDDVCQAFFYPACAAGLTVGQVLAQTNLFLAGDPGYGLTCTASELNQALDNANTQFNSCGNVIACPSNVGAGVFTCP